MAAPYEPFVPTTLISYQGGRPSEIRLRTCHLTVVDPAGGDHHRTRVVEQGSVRIGSHPDNDLVIEHQTVSRHHCRVVQEPDGYVIVDAGSTNGTYVDGVRVREAFLAPGQVLRLGQAEVRVGFRDERVRVTPSPKDHLGALLGGNVKMREIYGIIERIAPTGTSVVVEGETGTGKELVARTIHDMSDRRRGPLIVFDCGAVPPNLIESELFGHDRGSFTGAIMSRQGLFEGAHGGTLFLDEIGELALDLQPKLLRALEQREIRRVGSNKPIKVDVRVIAATNRDLEKEVAAGRFREDLFYRLSVVRVVLPPLRERRDDIPALVRHILEREPGNRDPAGRPRVRQVDPEAMELLSRYAWPGNVRELVNAVTRAVCFAEGGVVRAADLPEVVRTGGQQPSAGSQPGSTPTIVGPFKEVKERVVASFEEDYVRDLLRRHGGNISQAAREARIDRKYFRKLMRKYGLGAERSM